MKSDQKILSIVIPAYNISSYVDECLPTFIDKRLFDKVDIILVDDGATDDTFEKVNKYVKKYPNYFTFVHKDNGGHGSVINYALHNLIQTKYFKVIDGDDWTNCDNLVDFVSFLESNDFDLIINDFEMAYPDKSVYKKCYPNNFFGNYKGYYITIHSITYRTSIFNDHNILMREKVFYEDNEFVLFPLEFVKKIGYFDKPIYFYRLGNSDQSVSYSSMLKRRGDYELIKDDILNKFISWKLNNVETELLKYCAYSLSCFYDWLFESAVVLGYDKKEFYSLTNELKKHQEIFQIVKKKRLFKFIASFNFGFTKLKQKFLKKRLNIK